MSRLHRLVLDPAMRILVGLVSILLLPIFSSPALAQPSTVYVVNNRLDDTADQTLIGVIWRRLGLMDENGKPAKRKEGTNDLEQGTTKVGEVIVRNQQVIGWKNLDGTSEAYDLSGGANFAADAWSRVANNGTIEVMKHGMRGGSGWSDGGALQLDKKANDPVGTKGTLYNGFTVKPPVGQNPGPGTGRLADATAYQLPARTNENILIDFTVCHSSAHPTKGGTTLPSVLETAEEIPGVFGAIGYVHCAIVVFSMGITGNAGLVEFAYLVLYFQLADAKLIVRNDADNQAAKEKKVTDWAQRLPALECYNRVRQMLDANGFNQLGLLITFTGPTLAVPGATRVLGSPQPSGMSVVLDASGGRYDYAEGLPGTPNPAIVAAPGVLSGETEVQALILAEPGGSYPPSRPRAAGLPVLYSADGLLGPTLVGSLTLEVPFEPISQDVALYRLQGGAWILVPSVIVDYGAGRITLQTATMGVYQAFASVPVGSQAPGVGPLGLILLAAALGTAALIARPRSISAIQSGDG